MISMKAASRFQRFFSQINALLPIIRLKQGFSVYASRPIVGLVGTTRNIKLLGLKELNTPYLQNHIVPILVISLALIKGLMVLFADLHENADTH